MRNHGTCIRDTGVAIWIITLVVVVLLGPDYAGVAFLSVFISLVVLFFWKRDADFIRNDFACVSGVRGRSECMLAEWLACLLLQCARYASLYYMFKTLLPAKVWRLFDEIYILFVAIAMYMYLPNRVVVASGMASVMVAYFIAITLLESCAIILIPAMDGGFGIPWPRRTLILAIASYLTIGIGFASLYMMNDLVCVAGNGPPATSRIDYLYFSFVTVTTLGYGDLLPRADQWARMVAIIETLSGVFYLVVFVAAIVALIKGTPDAATPRTEVDRENGNRFE